jgi:hypothetical protein
MKLLYPEKNYTISANILEYRPPTKMDSVRLVRMTDEAAELDRKSKFSFAIMDMLQITPATKLMFLQVLAKCPLATSNVAVVKPLCISSLRRNMLSKKDTRGFSKFWREVVLSLEVS